MALCLSFPGCRHLQHPGMCLIKMLGAAAAQIAGKVNILMTVAVWLGIPRGTIAGQDWCGDWHKSQQLPKDFSNRLASQFKAIDLEQLVKGFFLMVFSWISRESLPLFEGDFEFEIFEEHVSTGLCSGDFLFAFASVGADDDKSKTYGSFNNLSPLVYQWSLTWWKWTRKKFMQRSQKNHFQKFEGQVLSWANTWHCPLWYLGLERCGGWLFCWEYKLTP